MSVYCIYDAEGRIIQSNKVFDPPRNYEATIRDFGQKFIKQDRPHLVPAEKFFVANEELVRMPAMRISVSKWRIKAGGQDTVVLTGCPASADYAVDHSLPGIGIVTPYSGKLLDGELEIGMDIPCLFTIRIERFPYRAFSVQIEAAE
jgi:hypothetical protein